MVSPVVRIADVESTRAVGRTYGDVEVLGPVFCACANPQAAISAATPTPLTQTFISCLPSQSAPPRARPSGVPRGGAPKLETHCYGRAHAARRSRQHCAQVSL